MKSLKERSGGQSADGELIPAQTDPRQQAAQADGVPVASGNYRRYTLIGTLVLVLGLGGFLVWAATAPLASAVISNGQVVIEGYRKTLQHLEGGIIEQINVEEGQTVEKGEVLVTFDGTQARSDLAVVESRLLTALGQRARLRAERDGESRCDFPEALTEAEDSAKAAEIMANQRAIFTARQRALETDLSLRAQRIDEFEEQIRGLQSRLTAVESQIASFTEEVDEWSGLVEDQLADKQSLRDARRRLDEYRGERGRLISDIAGIRAQIATTRMERSLRQEEYDQEVATRLGEVQERILDARARISALRDKLSRTVVTAPINGSVVGLKVHTVGGVVSPGEALMDIVPQQRRLLVDARVPPDKIDDVRVGQATDLSFPALNTLFINNIQGDVVSVSADALNDQQNNESYYLARIRVNQAGVEALQQENFQLEPGMPVQAFIKTGSRSFLAYLVKPFSEMASRAFREN
ncbi:HlyD family type I secretion periplasmic adaptor subunit [Spiribacter insolitus]|uniref:Membrane fusion protein (MFP) family protein n=1 Tax=Spiribacter insolitus TaxID=3122417 RepID=A0ABV3T909_9GAMM